MSKIRLVVGLILAAVLVLFIALNLENVQVNFLLGHATMPVAFVILISAGMGAGLVLAFRLLRGVRPPPK